MKKWILFFLFISLIPGCDRIFDVNSPVVDSSGFLTQTNPISEISKKVIEGVYTVVEGNENFGDQVVLKYSGNYLSIFTSVNVGYMVMQGGSLDSVLFFYGYWRYGISSETGLINFYISSFEGGNKIISGDTTGLQIIIRGSYGDGDNLPANAFELQYLRPFSDEVKQNNFYILAHRGGGRNSDYLQASENSVEMIQIAERLGANGIELDVKLTKDGIPIIYHDPDINLRLTQKSVIWGDIEDFTFAQLRTFIKLKNGENLPSLHEALETVVNKTNLRFVWLDLKSQHNEIAYVAKIIKEINKGNRNLEIVVGVPTIEKFQHLINFQKADKLTSLCELDVNYVRMLGSRVWAPRWTQGTQLPLVGEMHAEGRLAFSWTLDEPAFIETFLNEGEFDGVLTNHPTLVAYHYYIRQ